MKRNIVKTIKSIFYTFGIIFVAATIRSGGIYCFIGPNEFAPSGFTGIAVMIESRLHIKSAYMLFLLNLPVLIVGLIVLDSKFTVKTIAFVAAQSVMLLLIGNVDETYALNLAYASENGRMLAAIFGGILLGTSLALMLKIGGSTGGTDVIGVIIQKRRPEMSVSWIICFWDMLVIIASFFVYPNGLESVLYALICTYASGRTSNLFLKGVEERITLQVYAKDHVENLLDDLRDIPRNHVFCLQNAEASYIVCTFRKINLYRVKKTLKKYDNIKTYLIEAKSIK